MPKPLRHSAVLAAVDSDTDPSDSPLCRGLRLLEVVVAAPDGLGFGELLAASGLARASLARYLRDLRAAGYLANDGDDGRYRAGPGMAALVPVTGLATHLRRLAPPVLQDLSAMTGQTVSLFFLDGETIESLAKVVHPESLAMQVVGQRSQHFAEAPWGWLFWPTLDAAVRERLEAQQHAPGAATRACAIAAPQLAARGWVLDDCGTLAHTRRLAAPVIAGDGRVVAAIGIAGMRAVLDDAALPGVGSALVQAAAALQRRAFGGRH